MVFEPKTVRRQLLQIGQTTVDFIHPIADATTKVVVVRLAGHFVA